LSTRILKHGQGCFQKFKRRAKGASEEEKFPILFTLLWLKGHDC